MRKIEKKKIKTVKERPRTIRREIDTNKYQEGHRKIKISGSV